MAKKKVTKGKGTLAQRALGPAADAFGKEIVPAGRKAGAVAVRVSELLLRGIDSTVYGLERAGSWIKEAVSERLEGVSTEKIVQPESRIAVPALQALISSMDEELIREMFANLLAKDMNVDTKHLAHPSFVELIKQMTQSEAAIFSLLKLNKGSFKTSFNSKHVPMGRHDSPGGKIAYILPFVTLNFRDMEMLDAFVAISNLARLGLVDVVTNIKMARNGVGSSGSAELLMTPLGDRFAEVCVQDTDPRK